MFQMDYESTVDCIKACIISVKGGLPLHCLQGKGAIHIRRAFHFDTDMISFDG